MQNKMRQIKASIPILIIVVLACSISGCATLALNSKIKFNYYSTSPWKEIYGNKRGIHNETGKYKGEETIGNQKFARILLTGASSDCREKDSIELLIPTGTKISAKPIIRDSFLSKTSSSFTEGKVNIKMCLLDHQVRSGSVFLPKEDWLGYPGNVLLTEYGEAENERIIKVAYRIGPSDEDIIFSPADTSSLSWICRQNEFRKEVYYIFYPFAIAVDVVTSPIQVLLIALIFHSMDTQYAK